MSDNFDELGESLNIGDTISAAEELETLLGLSAIGLKIRGARIVGYGSRASADIYLSDKSAIFFESLRVFATPSRLVTEIASTTGATPRLKGVQAIKALSLLKTIAEHEETINLDDVASDWGTTFLQLASKYEMDIDDQMDRWRAFSHIRDLDPSDGSHHGTAIAKRSVVLVGKNTGERFVRCGWFRDFVKRDDGTVSPQEIGGRMKRVGWVRRGREGLIKATKPGFNDTLKWRFYVVPKDWEERWEGEE